MSDEEKQRDPSQSLQEDHERAVLPIEKEEDVGDVSMNNNNITHNNSENETNVDDNSRASESLSSISDSIVKGTVPTPVAAAAAAAATTTTTTAAAVDGSSFLSHLRAAGAFDSEIRNEDTFGRSTSRNKRQDLNALSALFEASTTTTSIPGTDNPFHRLSNEDTVGRSNRTNNVAAPKPK